MRQAAAVTVTVALVGIDEPDRRAVVSAISSLAAAQALPARLDWATEAQADVLVVNIDRPDAPAHLDALTAAMPRALLRYSAQRGPQVDVSRPIRVQGLRDALVRAFDDTLARPAPAADTPPAVNGFRYRGAALLQRAGAAATAAAAPGQRMYRGRPVEGGDNAPSEGETPASTGTLRVYRGKAY
jgi:hypothetical protein